MSFFGQKEEIKSNFVFIFPQYYLKAYAHYSIIHEQYERWLYMHVTFYLHLSTMRIVAVIHSYFDQIIAEEITHLSYYMKGNMASMHHRIFFSSDAFKEKNRKRDSICLCFVSFKKILSCSNEAEMQEWATTLQFQERKILFIEAGAHQILCEVFYVYFLMLSSQKHLQVNRIVLILWMKKLVFPGILVTLWSSTQLGRCGPINTNPGLLKSVL